MKPNQDETEDDMRQRAQACIRRVRLAGVDLGTKPDGNKAKLCLAVSQPPEKRRRAALAGEVKRLIIEAGGEGTVHRIEPEWRQSLRGVSHDIHPPGATPAGCGWIDLGAIARGLGTGLPQLEKTWEPLAAGVAGRGGLPPRVSHSPLEGAPLASSDWLLGMSGVGPGADPGSALPPSG